MPAFCSPVTARPYRAGQYAAPVSLPVGTQVDADAQLVMRYRGAYPADVYMHMRCTAPGAAPRDFAVDVQEALAALVSSRG